MKIVCSFAVAVALALPLGVQADTTTGRLVMTPLSRYATGIFNQSAAEIATYDAMSHQLFVVNAGSSRVDVYRLDPTDPHTLEAMGSLELAGVPNSVAVKNGLLAVAVEADPVTDPGQVQFFRADTRTLVGAVSVGALPDMVTFTSDGLTVLVANEGEPRGDLDPEGSVSVIDLSQGVENATVRTAHFRDLNTEALREAGVRITAGKTIAEDAEPEYIAVAPDDKTAYVALQENNAIAVVDIADARIVAVWPMGLIDHSLPGYEIDVSDRDGGINLRNWPIFGMHMPDSIATYETQGVTYIVTANEGDDRDDFLAEPESVAVSRLKLDPETFPDAEELQKDENLGRLRVSRLDGDLNGDGQHQQLWAYGTRSFSIWTTDGERVYDSGSDFERITAERFPNHFNASHSNNTFEGRSPRKGPEPEGVAIAQFGDRSFAFTGLERIGGVMVYEVTEPREPRFVEYVNNRNFAVEPAEDTTSDLGPEGLLIIPAAENPYNDHQQLLVVANEVSGSIAIYALELVND